MQGLALGVVRIFVPNVHEQAFRNVFATQWAVGGVALICFALIPESVHPSADPNFEAAHLHAITGLQCSSSQEARFLQLERQWVESTERIKSQRKG